MQQNQRIVLSSVQNTGKVQNAKTLLWTELGHNFLLIRLVGSNYGLSGLSYVTIRWLLPTTKLYGQPTCGKIVLLTVQIHCPEKVY